MGRSREAAQAIEAIVELERAPVTSRLSYRPTKDLVDYGKEIMRASREDPDKPGKVHRIAVMWLAERLRKLEGKA
jgi:hypothetical protein